MARNLMDVVASLPAEKIDKLYENSFVCGAILRCLPPLAKKYVLQLLHIHGPVTANSLEQWVLPDKVSKHEEALDALIHLRILVQTKKEAAHLMLNSTFQHNLQKHILQGGVLPMSSSNIADARLPSSEELDAYAVHQWENFLINSTGAENFKFQFLLMDTNAQLWYVIREYITDYWEEHGADTAADLISFLAELTFHATGKPYTFSTLSHIRRDMLIDLEDLGLVKLLQGSNQSWFIPTRLATDLCIDTPSRGFGFVLVEANFRMFAYSASQLHCEILGLFSEIDYQLPNLIVCAITKKSVQRAFVNGITAEEIISFLQQNAHPRGAERIPENVTDMIRLWVSELNPSTHR